jgi:hypothetical protein
MRFTPESQFLLLGISIPTLGSLFFELTIGLS